MPTPLKIGSIEYVVRNNGTAEGLFCRYVLVPDDPALAAFADGGHPIPEPIRPDMDVIEQARVLAMNDAVLAAFAGLRAGTTTWTQFQDVVLAAARTRQGLA